MNRASSSIRLGVLPATILLSIGLHACGDDECKQDAFACDPADVNLFAQNPNCTAAGSLEVELGQGRAANSYSPLTPLSPLQLEFGSQGGQHAFLGLRVLNADVVQSPLLLVEFYSAVASEGTCVWSLADAAIPTDAVAECWLPNARRESLIGVDPPLSTGADGVVQEAGWLVSIDSWLSNVDTVYRLGVVVQDQCGRTGHAFFDESRAAQPP